MGAPASDAPAFPLHAPAPPDAVSPPAEEPTSELPLEGLLGDEVTTTPRPAPPRRPGRPRRTRAAAVIALIAVGVAVAIVLAVSGGGSSTKTTGGSPVVKVLIPEGLTRLQIAKLAAKDGLTGSYRSASRRSTLLDPRRYGAPAGTPDLEGFLFPATYDMDVHAPVSRLVEAQLVALKENFGVSEIDRARSLHITPYQLLIVASMVEREAQVPADRAKIAAVIYNRLHQGMPLGIDATIYYALELREGTAALTHELTEADLHISSRYNTRVNTGLPPTPISNPGAASIHAAANPAHVSYLYYVLAADGCGEHVFSTTSAEFEANAAAYQAAVRKNGGKPPSCKKHA